MYAKIHCSSKVVRANARPLHISVSSCKCNCSCVKVVYGSERVTALEKKADKIRELALASTNPFDEEELMEALAQVKADIKKIEKDPLTNDFCKDTPWALECKVFDF